jgi:hypothetical protein
MRDNGPAPKRLHVSRSRDRGEHVERGRGSSLPNPGSGAEVTALANGPLVLVYNDLEQGRYSWPSHSRKTKARRGRGRGTSSGPARRGKPIHKRQRGGVSLPVDHSRPGTARCTPGYSYFVPPDTAKKDAEGRLIRKAIKHRHFNEAWIRARP